MTRSYGQACLAARALDVLGERWTLLIVRELAMGSRRFGELLGGLSGIGTNLLSARLNHLEAHGVVVRTALGGPGRSHAYDLTDRGRDLLPILQSLALWAAAQPSPPPPGAVDRTEWALFAMHAQAGAAGANYDTMTELVVDDEVFWVYGDGTEARFRHGAAPIAPSLRMTCSRATLHRLAGHVISVPEALAARQLTLDGDPRQAASFFATFTIPAGVLPARKRTRSGTRR